MATTITTTVTERQVDIRAWGERGEEKITKTLLALPVGFIPY